jgi:tetratricopeptide (TPR) repeat protein
MSDIEEREEKTHRMIQRLGGSSALVFVFDHWFGVAVLLFLSLMVFLGLFLPKIWTQTPDDFNPVIKVSGLDLLQARSLRRTAEKEAAAGRVEEAVQAWRSAVINNAADLENLRGSLRFVAGQKNPSKAHLEFGVNQSFWLMRLSKTNQMDLELAMDLMTRYGLNDYVVRLGKATEDRLTPASSELLTRSYFEMGQMQDFDRLWRLNEARFAVNPELMVYRNAWLANWGPPGTLQAGREALRAARNDPRLRLLASRLQLQVSFAMQDVTTYGQVLPELEEENQTRITDHCWHWMLITALGGREEARERAKNFTGVPASPMEARTLGTTYALLGLEEAASKLLTDQLRVFAFDPELWLLQVRNLMNLKDWSELRSLAAAMRSEAALQLALEGYSHFVETMAEHHLERPDAARAAAERLARSTLPSAGMARDVARQVRDVGYPDVSQRLLQEVEEAFKDDPDYWFERTVSAFLANEPDALIQAAEKGYQLNPDNPSIVNNYAASLLMSRRRPPEALKLTENLLRVRGASPDAQLNHALALIQNDRLTEAEALLRGMNTLNLGVGETSVYHMAWFEIHLARKDWKLARAAFAQIDPRRLVSLQAKWLEEKYGSIPD